MRHRTRRMEGVAPATPAGYRQALSENPSGSDQKRGIRAALQRVKAARAAARERGPPCVSTARAEAAAGLAASNTANGGRRSCDACGLPAGDERASIAVWSEARDGGGAAMSQKKPERPRGSAALHVSARAARAAARERGPPCVSTARAEAAAGLAASNTASGGRRSCDACGLPAGNG